MVLFLSLGREVVSDKEGDQGEEEGEDVSKQHSVDPLSFLSPWATFAHPLCSGKCSQNNALICDIIVWADLTPDCCFHPVTIDYTGLILTP